jgi:uncharacterized membrane protein
MAAILIGAVLLTSWDFVLDPAMSQTAMPFWYWHTPGAFFGMPYQNFAGWTLTGALFMSVAALLWRGQPLRLTRSQLTFALVIYIGNFLFATVMSLGAGFWQPVLLGIVSGVLPAVLCWQRASVAPETEVPREETASLSTASIAAPVVVPSTSK